MFFIFFKKIKMILKNVTDPISFLERGFWLCLNHRTIQSLHHPLLPLGVLMLAGENDRLSLWRKELRPLVSFPDLSSVE